MNKNEFKDWIMKPLENKFKVKIIFNSQNNKYYLRLGSEMGSCKDFITETYCIIRWHRDINRTFQTMFHELGHAKLHPLGNGFVKSFKEIEAEIVAKLTCDKLNIAYDSTIIYNSEETYINYFTVKYSEDCKWRGSKPQEPRMILINRIVEDIVNTIKYNAGMNNQEFVA